MDFFRSLLKFVGIKREISSVQFNVSFSIFDTYYVPPPGGYVFSSVCLSVCWLFENSKKHLYISVCKLLRVAKTNENILDCAYYPYVMPIFNIHKQAELTINNGLDLGGIATFCYR